MKWSESLQTSLLVEANRKNYLPKRIIKPFSPQIFERNSHRDRENQQTMNKNVVDNGLDYDWMCLTVLNEIEDVQGKNRAKLVDLMLS